MRGKRAASDVKANAVGLALVKGVPEASKATGIPQRTLRRWKDDPELAELGLSAREAVGEVMWVAIQVGLDEIYTGLRNPNERLKDKADAVFGLIEKRALLVGEATSRTENLTGELDDETKRGLRESLRRLREELTAGPADSAGQGSGTAAMVGPSEGRPEAATG